MPKILEVDIRPRRLRSGQWTIYEFTYYDEFVFSSTCGRDVRKGTRRIWPVVKQDNGRGMMFFTAKEAMQHFMAHKGDFEVVKGTMLHRRLKRMKLI